MWGVTEAVAHSAIWSIRSSSGSIPLAVVVEAAAIGIGGVSVTVGGSGLVAGGVIVNSTDIFYRKGLFKSKAQSC